MGVLLEKEVTTPDQYPLSLNGLVNGCNQKSNRDPVMQLNQAEVLAAVDDLRKKHLIVEKSGFGSRVPKYQHRFCNTEFSDLKLSDQEKAILCELFLRGPQTPGELRARAGRMATFSDVAEVESVLEGLATNGDEPLVVKLSREPGKRESRYAHRFGSISSTPTTSPEIRPSAADGEVGVEGLIARLERRVQVLETELASVEARLKALENR